MPRNYNRIYSLLVEDRADIIGHIAYALYKEEKIEFIARYKDENDGEEPTEEVLNQFNMISSNQSSIDKYKFVASCILQSFLDNSLEEFKKDVEDGMNKNHLELMRKVVEPMKPKPVYISYLHGIAQSVIGAFAFMLLLCGIIFLLRFSDTQYTFTFGGSGSATIEQTRNPENFTPQDSVIIERK